MLWVDILQLIGTVSQKQNYGSPKGKVSTFKDFHRTMDFDGLGLCFHFWQVFCLRAEFYNLNGNPIMESVVLRSGCLLKAGALLRFQM